MPYACLKKQPDEAWFFRQASNDGIREYACLKIMVKNVIFAVVRNGAVHFQSQGKADNRRRTSSD